MISQTVEYALRAVVHLAGESPQSCTTQQVAAVTQVPAAYLSKVLQSLVKAGIVKSQRGIGGGVSLVSSPASLTILDVVNAVDPIQRIQTCPLDLKTHAATLCPLHRRLDNAMAEVENAFRSTTLAEVLGESGEPMPLCDATIPPRNAKSKAPVSSRKKSG
ncbi:MAG: Rrf2 family transcriptional regulator [Planctomycetes bacterium]|nr:Rrf2 family transcriptional regulator [Planctomycetota bacterium]